MSYIDENDKFVYVYKNPEEDGYTKIKVSKSLHNSVFKYRKRTLLNSLFVKYEYYINHWNLKVLRLPTLLTKVLTTLLLPVSLIQFGVSNYKEVFREVYSTWNPRKTGSFTVDDIQGDKYREVVKEWTDVKPNIHP